MLARAGTHSASWLLHEVDADSVLASVAAISAPLFVPPTWCLVAPPADERAAPATSEQAAPDAAPQHTLLRTADGGHLLLCELIGRGSSKLVHRALLLGSDADAPHHATAPSVDSAVPWPELAAAGDAAGAPPTHPVAVSFSSEGGPLAPWERSLTHDVGLGGHPHLLHALG